MEKHYRNIKNEMAYFNKVLKNMDIKQSIKDSKINNNETVFEDIENLFSYEDKYFCDSNLLGWIELIKNTALHKAIKSLSIEEQTLLSYIFYKEKTQTETAKIYNTTQQSVNKKISKTLNKVRSFLLNK